MSQEKRPYNHFDHDKYARSCAPDDFLGQIKRTVHGVPVSDDQTNMIVDAVKSGLLLSSSDFLLDVACGNGVLSKNLFDSCGRFLGVDASEYMISVAKKNFAKPEFDFKCMDGLEFVRSEPEPEKFTKMLIYAGFQYFSVSAAEQLLSTLRHRFVGLESIFIGNLPDKSRAESFYKERQPSPMELVDPLTAIGVWRTESEFSGLAKKTGWSVKFSRMPLNFYASHYRFDAILRPS